MNICSKLLATAVLGVCVANSFVYAAQHSPNQELAQLQKRFDENQQTIQEKQQQVSDENQDLIVAFDALSDALAHIDARNNPGITVLEPNSSEAKSKASDRDYYNVADFEYFKKTAFLQLELGASLSQTRLNTASLSGEISHVSASRVANVALLDKLGYLAWDKALKLAVRGQNTIAADSDLLNKLAAGYSQSLWVDNSFELLRSPDSVTPSIETRLQQTGVVGALILAILVIGLGIGLVRTLALTLIDVRIHRQLKEPESLGNNPLAKVIKVYQNEQHLNFEALELRLLETIVGEQAKLEAGLSLLKLFAALAPMLGLLGTVVGMIDTFQAITTFGNADPKHMAGGISMALTTTVLGLVAAMPLLFLHTILNSKAQKIRITIEKQGLALVAQRAETNFDSRGVKLGQ